ncbi:hypothetical protein, partial [Acinetobacter baumannii]|uniref:hypothetical protein n=1 Tax=Acinetobacter baumannii TaxID=470 RepID=UPI001C0795FF
LKQPQKTILPSKCIPSKHYYSVGIPLQQHGSNQPEDLSNENTNSREAYAMKTLRIGKKTHTLFVRLEMSQN